MTGGNLGATDLQFTRALPWDGVGRACGTVLSGHSTSHWKHAQLHKTLSASLTPDTFLGLEATRTRMFTSCRGFHRAVQGGGRAGARGEPSRGVVYGLMFVSP